MQRGTVVLEYLDIEYQGFDEGKAGNDCNLRLNFKRNEDEKKIIFVEKYSTMNWAWPWAV